MGKTVIPDAGVLMSEYNAVTILRTLDSKNPARGKVKPLLLSLLNGFFESIAAQAPLYFEAQAQQALAAKPHQPFMLKAFPAPFVFVKGTLVIRSAAIKTAEKSLETAGFPDVPVTYFDLRALPGFEKILATARGLGDSQIRFLLTTNNGREFDLTDSTAASAAGDGPVSFTVRIDTRYPFDGKTRYPAEKKRKQGIGP